MLRTTLWMGVLGLAILGAAGARAGTTADAALKKGFIRCGVNTGIAGFAQPDSNGEWRGIDVEFCRAVAAALFGDARKVRYTPLTAQQRFTALQSGEVDILSRNTTWTMSRDTSLGLNFVGINFYDGQGFMVTKKRNVKSATKLNGAAVCVQPCTTTELNLSDYFRANNMKFEEIKFGKLDEVVKAYNEGKCDTFTADVSQLYALRLNLSKPDDHVILPDVISKEPLAPVVRQRDDDWMMIVKWTLYAMINAEELGITSKNIDEALKSKKPDVMRLVGTEGAYGEDLGLSKDWAARIIRHVGNYGEIYDRNVGEGSKLKIPRGLNSLWSNGGIQYAPPIR
jgi:general L-amino acid transport system substrate-binding protein